MQAALSGALTVIAVCVCKSPNMCPVKGVSVAGKVGSQAYSISPVREGEKELTSIFSCT
jgi:hypothetical protein